MKIPLSAITNVIDHALRTGAKKATKYLSERTIVRATVLLKSSGNTEIRLTLGRPNVLEKEFIRKAKRAREPFPIKKVQLKFPKKKKR